jgi:acyl-CoA thioesterase FadM
MHGVDLWSIKPQMTHSVILNESERMEPVFPINIRFSDLDRYKHVSSSRYVDFVGTALWMRSGQGLLSPQVARLEIEYRRPVGLDQVKVRFASSDSATRMQFDILNASEKTAHARGYVDSDVGSLPPVIQPGENVLDRAPLLYTMPIDIRHNDLTPNSQLELSQYLEFVLSSRWQFLKKLKNMEATVFENRGIGFFMTKADIRYRKPVEGITTVLVRSWIGAFRREHTEISLPFLITTEDGSEVFADGVLDFSVIDFSSGRAKRVTVPEWGNEFFYEN